MKEVCKLLDVVYTVCLAVFVLACIAMLLVQVGCLIMMNGAMSVWIKSFIIPKAGVVASIMVIAVVILSYLRRAAQKAD